jgi:hypothetical protein
MPIDTSKPPDNQDFPTFPGYMRALLKDNIDPAYVVWNAFFTVAGTLTVGTNKSWELPILVDVLRTPTIVSAIARVKTAPTGADILVDINKGGTTIFTSQVLRPKIVAGSQTSSQTTPDVATLADGDILSLDIDQVGSTIAGADLTVVVRLKQRVIFP